MVRSETRSKSKTPDHIIKGNLVEEIAALLHAREGVTIEPKKRLRTLSDPTQIREVDVLVTGNVAGYPVRIAIECKNYSKRISAAKIDEFAGKLTDVGLSVRNSVYISVEGFARDAKRRAKDYGIKLLQLEGLTADRLSSVIHQVFQSVVHLLLRVEGVSLRSTREHDSLAAVMLLKDRYGNTRGGIWDIIWEQWQQGEIPAIWGEQELVIKPPKGWNWHIDDPEHPREVIATVKVIGLVITVAGEAHRHALRDILEQKYDRFHIRANFSDTLEALKLTVVENDTEFHAATRPGGLTNIVFDSERAPRIHIANKMYWPPTERAFEMVEDRLYRFVTSSNPDFRAMEDSLQAITFEEMEGTDISAIWSKGWQGHPASRGEDWPVKFPPSSSKPVHDVAGKRRVNPKKRRPQQSLAPLQSPN